VVSSQRAQILVVDDGDLVLAALRQWSNDALLRSVRAAVTGSRPPSLVAMQGGVLPFVGHNPFSGSVIAVEERHQSPGKETHSHASTNGQSGHDRSRRPHGPLRPGSVGEKGGRAPKTLLLVQLRASQINGCSYCVDMHARELKEAGETDERLFAVAAWRDSPLFTDAERAALALTEGATRLSDREDPVSDETWEEATRHYDERALADLILNIAPINFWNRVNVPTRQVAGAVPR
jgi:AhpD family alkylhydroperoxidase